MKHPIFVTGNADKVKHLNHLLGITLDHRQVDLVEVQSLNPEEVVNYKAREAFEALQCPVLVDDASMWFVALNGLPGPFIKHFISVENGLDNLCRMADGLSSRRAIARAYFGIYDGSTMHILHGEIHGEIAESPRGEYGFAYGWDRIFCPDGYDGRTRAELTTAEYDAVYEQIRPIAELKALLGGA